MTTRRHRPRTYRYVARVVVRRGKATVRICRKHSRLRWYSRADIYVNGVKLTEELRPIGVVQSGTLSLSQFRVQYLDDGLARVVCVTGAPKFDKAPIYSFNYRKQGTK